MADAVESLPFKSEYAKSGRASCKACRSTIEKDSLRLAAMVQSHAFDGKVPHWYHFICFFTKQRPQSAGDFEGFDSLKWDDQEKLRKKVAEKTQNPVEAAKANGKTSKRALKEAIASSLKDYVIEYAKSSRATCRGCEIKIAKDEIRISKKDFESAEAKRYGGMDRWHHVECFAKLRDELQFFNSGQDLPGFNTLKKEDKETIRKALPEVQKSKVKDEVDGPSDSKKIKKEEESRDKFNEKLKKQSKLLNKYLDALKEVKRTDMHTLLENNNLEIPSSDLEACRQKLADSMAFGVPLPCKICKEGEFVFKSGLGYQCQGNISGFTKCLKIEEEPERCKFKVPEDIDEYSFLSKYKCKLGKRLFEKRTRQMATVSAKDEVDSYSGPKVERKAPLRHMIFLLDRVKNKDDLKKTIIKLGGSVTDKVINEITAVISTQERVDELGSRMAEVEKLGIHVVPVTFFEKCVDGNAENLIAELAISPWGENLKKRIDAAKLKSGSVTKSGKSKSVFTKSVPSKMTLKLKGGLAVDPDSELEDVAHVYVEGKDIYNCVFSKANVQDNTNSFYKLQLLAADNNKSKYWVFRSWGRIGTTIGDKKLEKFSTLHEAKEVFCFQYEDKTGNDFNLRHCFEKKPGKYYPVDIDYSQSDIKMETESSVPSKLADPVQKLVTLLFDTEIMKKVMLEYELDMEKMPLGKLSRKQIQEAYSVLGELQKNDGDIKPQVVVDVTNRFYSIIPHNFGTNKAPLLDTKDIIQCKLEMLESLLEMEVAYGMLKETKGESDGELHPVDVHYSKLNTNIEVVDTSSEEYLLIENYVKNTHAETHMHYSLEIEELFKIKRKGEDKRFKPFKKLHNRKLLWHGSRLTNYAGILSQGLRIAPPEAPVTGYMFGKGIYFADMVSKSANYCMTSKDNNTGLLLLCEVALGEMYERTQADYIEKLPKGKHSTKGMGVTGPDPTGSVHLEDGLEVPAGKGMKAMDRASTSLLYNEYIVYDPAQVRSKYLLKVNFKYQY